MNLIYLDHNASSPVAPEAVAAMQPWLAHCGNPTSTHAWGRQAAMAIEEARADLAALLGCAAEELFFTSGGTESDNLAILGLCDPARPAHLICSAIEHPAVLNTVGFLESRGWSVSRVGVDGQGVLKLAELEAALRADTRLVSVMLANNEVGSLQPVHEISRLVRARGIPLHSDAAQAVGKHRVKVDELGVDLLTVAGHKLNAPIGVGALYVRKGIELQPLCHGASHERGLRPGTPNVLEIVGLGAAARRFEMAESGILEEYAGLRDHFERVLRETLPAVRFNAGRAPRLGNTSSVSFPGIRSGDLMAACPRVAASAGAACHRDHTEPSHVLAAMGLPLETIESTLRFSVGLGTTREQLNQAITLLAQALRELGFSSR
ncbi:MAG: cysteine desulfurase [Calditrichaeota bacterium]|nr:cysteine desulfurase [Calditrichota bacterium]